MSWPDWSDAGRRVEITMDDGRVIAGRLCLRDTWFDGEDEIPLWVVQDDHGVGHSFAGHETWRFSQPLSERPGFGPIEEQ